MYSLISMWISAHLSVCVCVILCLLVRVCERHLMNGHKCDRCRCSVYVRSQRSDLCVCVYGRWIHQVNRHDRCSVCAHSQGSDPMYIYVCVCMCRNDGECHGSPDPHEHVHRLSDGIPLPGLHSLLRSEGLLRHLCHHICTELHSLCPQLQATCLLERGLEATAPSQAGLRRKKQRRKNKTKKNVTSELLTCHQETLLPYNVHSVSKKKLWKIRGQRSQVGRKKKNKKKNKEGFKNGKKKSICPYSLC